MVSEISITQQIDLKFFLPLLAPKEKSKRSLNAMQSISAALVCYILTKKPFNRGENNETNKSWGPRKW